MKCYLNQLWYKGATLQQTEQWWLLLYATVTQQSYYNKKKNGSCYFNQHWHNRAITMKKTVVVTALSYSYTTVTQQSYIKT